MSYSFSVTADTKDEASEKVEAELDVVVSAQAVHTADRQAVQDTVKAFLAVLRDLKDNEHVYVYVSGSLAWQDGDVFVGASVSVSAQIELK